MLSHVVCTSVTHFFCNVTLLFQHLRVCTIASAPSLFYSDRLTSAQFRILFFFENLVVTLGLSGAPVAFLIQHMADHHPDEAEEEENRHHGQNRMVCVALLSSISRTFRWRIKRDKGEFLNYRYNRRQRKQKDTLLVQRPQWQPDITVWRYTWGLGWEAVRHQPQCYTAFMFPSDTVAGEAVTYDVILFHCFML